MRNKTKHIIHLAYYTLLAGCLLLSCTEEETGEGKDAVPALQIHVEAQDFSSKVPEQTPTRQVLLRGFSFNEGDTIGITSIRNGAILKDNIPYRKIVGDWAPATGETPKVIVPEDEATTFIAYYPYSVAMTGKKTEDEIFDAFGGVAADQSTYEKYAACDLMTSTGTLVDNRVNFKLSHRMALISIDIEQGWAPANTLKELMIDGNAVLPFQYRSSVNGYYHYFYLMKVTAASQTVELTGRGVYDGVWQIFTSEPVVVRPGYASIVLLPYLSVPGI
jgi:hypothetical protein